MMQSSELEPTYEVARRWTVRPVSHPPPGWAQIVRAGLAAWMREKHSAAVCSLQESILKPGDGSPLLSLVAAMIAEVCQ